VTTSTVCTHCCTAGWCLWIPVTCCTVRLSSHKYNATIYTPPQHTKRCALRRQTHITTRAFSNVLNTIFSTTLTLLTVVMKGVRCGAVGWGATSRKVAGSVPGVVTGIFHSHNPSGRTMALSSTQHLTEMSTRNFILFSVQLNYVMSKRSQLNCTEYLLKHHTM